MPEFSQDTIFSSDKSSLRPGRKPAYLCLITEEPIPDGWAMGDKGAKTMYRWHFAVWDIESALMSVTPEHQSAVSSRTFSPGGKNPASKSFLWTTELLQRRPNPGERINLDPLMPLACKIKVERQKNDGTPIDYARVVDLEGWPEGAAVLTPELKTSLMQLAQQWQDATPALQPAASAPLPQAIRDIRAPSGAAQILSRPAPQAPAVNPNMVGWGNPQGEIKPPSPLPTW